MTLEIQQDRELTSLNTLGLPVRAEYFVSARSEQDVSEALEYARDNSLPVTVLGGGSNVVFTGDRRGLVIFVALPGILFDNERVEAGAGENWHHTVLASLEQGLSGIENLSLIPGSVGAAPIQNIGAYGAELAAVFDSLTAIDRGTLEVVEMTRSDCRFGYRDSIFKGDLRERMVITRVRLALRSTFEPNLTYEALHRELDHCTGELTPLAISEAVCAIRRRKLPDPERQGNVGSFFKNPVVTAHVLAALQREYGDVPHWAFGDGHKLAAGWLIEQCGLKGVTRGGAMISSRHALVIVNRGDATPRDVVELAGHVQARVQESFDIALEIEPVLY